MFKDVKSPKDYAMDLILKNAEANIPTLVREYGVNQLRFWLLEKGISSPEMQLVSKNGPLALKTWAYTLRATKKLVSIHVFPIAYSFIKGDDDIKFKILNLITSDEYFHTKIKDSIESVPQKRMNEALYLYVEFYVQILRLLDNHMSIPFKPIFKGLIDERVLGVLLDLNNERNREFSKTIYDLWRTRKCSPGSNEYKALMSVAQYALFETKKDMFWFVDSEDHRKVILDNLMPYEISHLWSDFFYVMPVAWGYERKRYAHLFLPYLTDGQKWALLTHDNIDYCSVAINHLDLDESMQHYLMYNKRDDVRLAYVKRCLKENDNEKLWFFANDSSTEVQEALLKSDDEALRNAVSLLS